MNAATYALFAIVAVLGINQTVMRIPALMRMAWLFWAVITLDVVLASVILWYGVPGLGTFPAVKYVIGPLFLLHVAQNISARLGMEEESRRARIARERAEWEADRDRRRAEEEAEEE